VALLRKPTFDFQVLLFTFAATNQYFFMSATYEATREYAQSKDQTDIMYSFRERFLFPQHNDTDVRYFCGNSLGLQPKSVSYLMQKELSDWAKYGVEGHFRATMPWFSYHHFFEDRLAKIVGAQKEE